MKRDRLTAVIALISLVLMVLMVCSGNTAPLDFLFTLAFGWVRYVWRVGPQVRVNWAAVGLAAACVALITVIGHGLCAWMWRGTGRSSHWQWRWTGIGLAVLVLMFAAGTAAVGVAHQTAWLLSSPRPMFKYGSGRLDLVRCQSNLRQLHQCIAIYHSDHGQYPERLADLVDAGILEYPEVLICPASSDEAAPGPTTRQRVEQLAEPRHQSYIYVPRALKTDAASTNPSSRTDRFDEVVIYEKLHHHDGGGIHVLYTDGTTEYLDAERTQRFLASRPAATNPK